MARARAVLPVPGAPANSSARPENLRDFFGGQNHVESERPENGRKARRLAGDVLPLQAREIALATVAPDWIAVTQTKSAWARRS